MGCVSFAAFRLNIVHASQTSLIDDRLKNDTQIFGVIERATTSERDEEVVAKTKTYRWSLRDSKLLREPGDDRGVLMVRLACSTLSENTSLVTDDSIERVNLTHETPPAEFVHIFFFEHHHLVLVEKTAFVTRSSKRWLQVLNKIISTQAKVDGFASETHIQPVIEFHEFQAAIRSFSMLRKVEVSIKLPNPLVTRTMKELFDFLTRSGVKRLKQRFENEEGLSQEPDAIQIQSLEMHALGYGEGEAKLTGEDEDGEELVIQTGERPIEVETQLNREQLEEVRGEAPQESRDTIFMAMEEAASIVSDKARPPSE